MNSGGALRTPEKRTDSDAPRSGIRSVPRPSLKAPKAPPAPLRSALVVPSASSARTVKPSLPPPPPSQLSRNPGPPRESVRAAVRPRISRVELGPRLAQRPTLDTIVNEAMTAPPEPLAAPEPVTMAVVVEESPACARVVPAAPPIPPPVELKPEPAPKPNPVSRTFTTTAQDWPIAQVPSAPGLLLPEFGLPPTGAPGPRLLSLPAFLPPPGMLDEASNCNVALIRDSEAVPNPSVVAPRPPMGGLNQREELVPAVVLDPQELATFSSPGLVQRMQGLPRWLCFASGVAAGVRATLLLV